MTKDWASECADRWVDRVKAIERAAWAAIERAHDLGIPADKQLSIGQAVRGLGVPK